MKIENIKPIPKYIREIIRKRDKQDFKGQDGQTRYYAYLTKNDGELVKVTVAVKNAVKKKIKNWYCKQVAVHGVNSSECFVKDMAFYYIGGFVVDWYSEGIQKNHKRWDYENCWGEGYDAGFDPNAPVINPEYALKFPEYKYSAADKYTYVDILNYLRFYKKYPQTEMLVKFGLSAYATSKIIVEKVIKDKTFRKWLIQHRNELSENQYYIRTILNAFKSGKPVAKLQKYENNKKQLSQPSGFAEIRKLFPTDDGKELLLKYLYRNDANLSSYSDYIQACNFLNLDMSIERNILPRDFQRWHDIRIDEYSTAKAIIDAEKRKELYAKFATIAEKYLPLQRNLQDAFIVIIARTPADLIHEGDYLHHCVGRMNYDQRMIREESLIFFIRDKNTPDTPYVTIEYSPKNKKILQCYGYKDKRPKADVLDFVNNKWLPYANRKLEQIAA
ncbi:MAG: PcfJ domain-containing protein [Eubacterium sp.]|nr:PcfJ domain-containing protein [Eubacterium sp.]